MMWFKANVIMAIFLIVSLNAKEVSANINKYMEAEYFDDVDNNNSNDKLKRIIQEISARHVQDKSRTGDSILDEQLKWINNNHETSNSMSSKDRDVMNEAIIHLPMKKYDTSRLCGSKLVDAIIKLCNGCVKPIGGKAVTTKRSLRSYAKRGQTLTEKCCMNRCSFEEMKSYCC